MKRTVTLILAALLCVGMSACAAQGGATPTPPPEAAPVQTEDTRQQEEEAMRLTIDGTQVPVTWEDNASVDALRALTPLEIRMSMYGGFEQVGPIGRSIARDDAQTATAPGDIVLYSGNQIVIFYGTNAWAYTRLGHVDLPEADMADLLGHGDVTIVLGGEADGQ